MARATMTANLDVQFTQLEGMGRDAVKRIVMAGAEVLTEVTRQNIDEYHHVGKTGSMRMNVKPGEYREGLGNGSVYVYPQENDNRGVSNAMKAFVIDRGIGHRPTTKRSHGKARNKTGDHFLTKKTVQAAEEKTVQAMEAEYDRIIAEANK